MTINRPEIFIGLVAPVGSDIRRTIDAIESFLKSCDYDCVEIHVSSLIYESGEFEKPENVLENQRIDSAMESGDSLRERYGSEYLTRLCIAQVRRERNKITGDSNRTWSPIAYIINSLKHPDEVEFLREIYKDHFICISLFEPTEQRVESLQRRILESGEIEFRGDYQSEAQSLVRKDEFEPGRDWGQNVRETFPLADVFLDGSRGIDLEPQINRFLQILFGHPFITPTIEEYGLFQARAASLRSADLSRQVGAAIFNSHGELLVSGCNEVPIHGGGAFWSSGSALDKDDNRDFVRRYDSSAIFKNEMVKEVLERIPEEWWSDEFAEKSIKEKVRESLYADNAPLRGSRISSILEYGRVVHAEMHAISEAARRGISIKDSTLFCTTFPCHICARHIIAAGISRVVFIEPYPKSIAKDLYSESITIGENNREDNDLVKFDTFVGISPEKFMKFFSMRPRKNKMGHILDWNPKNSDVTISRTVGYVVNEMEAIENL